jgi:hypothetical protein
MATTITFDSSVTAATEPSGSGSTSHYFSWANIINNVHENSTINASKQVWYRVSRNSGSVGSGELGYTSGWEALTQIGTSNNYTFDVDVLINDDGVDETARQGESFTLSIYSHSSQYQLIGSVNFTLYDADFSASSISPASQTIASNATSASVTLTQSQTPEAANPNMFMYNTSTLTGWYPSVGFGTSTTQSLTLPSTMLPPAGSTSNYIIRLYNGTAWYLQQPWNFSITKSAAALVAPTSNGAIATESSTSSPISVTLGFSSYGSGGVFQVMQSTVHSNPPPAGTWTTVSEAPYVFSQSRGTTRYYYSRRYDSSTGNTAVGTPTPVGEQVPTTPVLSSVTDTATSHTVVLSNNPSSDGITTVYYYQSQSSNAMASDTAWRDQGTDSPPSGWQTSPTFTGISTTTTYYYWAMGWTDSNPGPDGAVLSGPISKNSSGGSSSLSYGMEIYDAGNNLRMSTAKRQPRLVGYVSGTGNGSTFSQSWTNFNTPSPAEWLVVSLEGNSNYYATQGTTAGSFQATRADVRTSNSSNQVLSGSEDYRFAILRY